MLLKAPDQRTVRIAELNDRLRKGTLPNGRLVVTANAANEIAMKIAETYKIEATSPAYQPIYRTQLAKALAGATIDVKNNPYFERDFGTLEVLGVKLFFKIDYYDCEMKSHSADAADHQITVRVCTVMLPSDY